MKSLNECLNMLKGKERTLVTVNSTDFILISLTMAYGIGRSIALERNKADFL